MISRNVALVFLLISGFDYTPRRKNIVAHNNSNNIASMALLLYTIDLWCVACKAACTPVVTDERTDKL